MMLRSLVAALAQFSKSSGARNGAALLPSVHSAEVLDTKAGIERRRALEWTGELLRSLAVDHGEGQEREVGILDSETRRIARTLLEIYPTRKEIREAALSMAPLRSWISAEPPLEGDARAPDSVRASHGHYR